MGNKVRENKKGNKEIGGGAYHTCQVECRVWSKGDEEEFPVDTHSPQPGPSTDQHHTQTPDLDTMELCRQVDMPGTSVSQGTQTLQRTHINTQNQ